ncbi:MAG: pantetheine-phosphate adenylyltransferase [Rikenellaceae bacterium]|jgi:pantetheine-phosphate adenylyltransferase|nr:pantetheine-phosphate adenylyltransferase [Rikenellaceae bacterium]
MERVALFPGSFEPFTIGHKAIVDQGLGIFDRIVVGVGGNESKGGFMSVANRVRLIEDIFRDNDRVEARSYGSLTGEFCREMNIRFILRGMRNTVDYEYERGIMLVNQRLYPEITTVLLFTPPEYVAISSSVIRELAHFGKDPRELIPNNIEIKNYL